MRASRRWMPGVSGFACSLTAFMNTRRPSLRRSRAARPGEKPCGCVTASTTRAPRRSSSSARTSRGTSSQWMRTPLAGTELEKDAPPQLQVVVDAALDGVSHVVRQRHHQVLVVRGTQRKTCNLDGRMELDAPLAWQRDHAERAEPRPERSDRQVVQAEKPGDGSQVAD